MMSIATALNNVASAIRESSSENAAVEFILKQLQTSKSLNSTQKNKLTRVDVKFELMEKQIDELLAKCADDHIKYKMVRLCVTKILKTEKLSSPAYEKLMKVFEGK